MGVRRRSGGTLAKTCVVSGIYKSFSSHGINKELERTARRIIVPSSFAVQNKVRVTVTATRKAYRCLFFALVRVCFLA